MMGNDRSAALAKGQQTIMVTWADAGSVAKTEDGVMLTGVGLRSRLWGSRHLLADAGLLWPEGKETCRPV